MTDLLQTAQLFVMQYGLRLLGAIAIFLIGRWLAGQVTKLVKRGMERAEVNQTLVQFVGNLTYYGLLTWVIIAAIGNLGVQTTTLVAVIGAAGLAIGLALQGSLANFAAGVMLIIFRPFKVDDLVEVAGTFGRVEEIQIFNTILATPDNKTVIIANSSVTGNQIVNYSTKGILRVDMVFGIGYDDNLLKAKQLLSDILTANELVLSEPAPTVAVMELGDSSVNFAVRPFATVANYWAVYFSVTEQVKLQFDEAGISIPYPQQDVHLVEANAPLFQGTAALN